MPFKILPRMLASAGDISDVAMTWAGKNRLATAVRNGSGRLEIILWDFSDTGIKRRKSITDLPIQKVAIGNWNEGVVTVCLDDGGNLQINYWEITEPSGEVAIRRSDDHLQLVMVEYYDDPNS